MTENKTLWQRLRAKYRVAVLNEETLGEMLHMRLSLWNLVLVFIAMMLLSLGLFAFLVWITPLKNYLPGFNEGIREQLVLENERVDSLLTVLSVQDEYLASYKSVIAGEVEPDSVRSLDSLYVIRKEELLAAKSQITEEFMADYEQNVSDNLTLFDQAISQEEQQVLCRPVSGVITTHYKDGGYQGIHVQTAEHANAQAVLAGVVISSSYNIQEGWTVMVQHEREYVSIYSGLEKTMQSVGGSVKAGETIGLVGERLFGFQLWQKGKAIDPETVILF